MVYLPQHCTVLHGCFDKMCILMLYRVVRKGIVDITCFVNAVSGLCLLLQHDKVLCCGFVMVMLHAVTVNLSN